MPTPLRVDAAARVRAPAALLVTLTCALVAGCSKPDTSSAAGDSAAATPAAMPAPAPASAPAATSAPAGTDTIVRGTVASVSDSALTLSSPGGEVRVVLTQPVQVYDRQPGDLARVSERAFIGVTSVAQPDGSQRATEIHVFPEELRGLGEGSRPMAPPAGQPGGASGGGGRSTMTNGTVAAPNASRMTNGAVRAQAGGTLTVEYQGGSQTIAVPAGVPVTVIAPTKTPLSAGTNVVVPARKRADGTLETSRVMLASRPRP